MITDDAVTLNWAGITPDDFNIPTPVIEITNPEDATPIAPSAGTGQWNTALPVANEGLPYCMGELFVSMNTANRNIYQSLVYFDEVLQKAEVFEAINNGGIRIVPNTMPDFFRKRSRFDPMCIPLNDAVLLSIRYKDAPQKHPDLAKNYRLTVIVQTLQRNPALEQLPPEIQNRIIEDFLASPYEILSIDEQKYIADPLYSLLNEPKP